MEETEQDSILNLFRNAGFEEEQARQAYEDIRTVRDGYDWLRKLAKGIFPTWRSYDSFNDIQAKYQLSDRAMYTVSRDLTRLENAYLESIASEFQHMMYSKGVIETSNDLDMIVRLNPDYSVVLEVFWCPYNGHPLEVKEQLKNYVKTLDRYHTTYVFEVSDDWFMSMEDEIDEELAQLETTWEDLNETTDYDIEVTTNKWLEYGIHVSVNKSHWSIETDEGTKTCYGKYMMCDMVMETIKNEINQKEEVENERIHETGID